MADNTTLNAGSGGDTISTDDIAGIKVQRVKVQYGTDGSATDVSDSNPLPIDDAGGSLTVDNAALSVTGGGVEASALRVTLASDSTGVVSVDDNGGSLTVDGTVTANAGTGPWPVTDNGGSLTVDNAGITTIAGAVSGTEMQVDVVASLPAGTNAIGKLAANSGVDIGDVDVTSQPARVATTDTITAKIATDAIQNGTTALTPKFAVIDHATSGDNTLIAAVAGKKIRVLAYTIVASGAVNVRFEDGAAGTALTGQMNLTTNSGVSVPFCPVGHFETSINTILNLELSGGVSVDGHLTYIEV